MAQDTRTTNDIINNAFYLIGEVSPDRVPDAPLVNRGLYVLNDLLDSFSGNQLYIPCIKEITVQLVPNQATYIVSNIVAADFNYNRIVELEFVGILQEDIYFPIQIVDQAVIYNNVRYPTLPAMPQKVALNRLELESDLTFYPTPSLAFTTLIRGKFLLDRLSLFQVINEVPPYFYRFLRYALGRELANYYPSSTWSQTNEAEYQMMYKRIQSANELNLLIDPDWLLMTPYRNSYYTAFGIT